MTVKANEHIGNQMVKDLVELRDELVDMLRKEAGHRVGYEDDGNRKTRALARKAWQGDTVAWVQLQWKHAHLPTPESRAAFYEQLAFVHKEFKAMQRKYEADAMAMGE